MTGVVSVMRKRWLDRHEIKAALGQPRSPSFCFRADWSVAPMSLKYVMWKCMVGSVVA